VTSIGPDFANASSKFGPETFKTPWVTTSGIMPATTSICSKAPDSGFVAKQEARNSAVAVARFDRSGGAGRGNNFPNLCVKNSNSGEKTVMASTRLIPAARYAACGIPGDPSPSEADSRFTRRLFECSRILQIQMLDHVIVGAPAVGRRGYFSFKEAGVIS
jgi:RadC-like JAB domain